ncbi:ThuA domain-containing protein [Novosphingobium sp. KACC 22771]|uniref:ThuA domain-containing protein n=1 Tax=Novosphingobium sp. KACC 22771 TaxID=3025670 RepID=UPI0023662B8E|nr:ThuA domain-containing protein [Novosphingobium sp. KACC 22771]WDF74314.1 ThuA domain-containing protein [Novosphingobium sp. KACC 22771]
MAKWLRFWMIGLGLALAHPAWADTPADCPLRDAPFSSATPLIDILLSPAAKAVVRRDLPTLPLGTPNLFTGTTAPSFAAIVTLHEAADLMGKRDLDFTAVDRDLAAIPVTDADRVARCARYDTAPPALAPAKGRPRVLLFEKINGFRDGPSVDAAHAAFVGMAARRGWSLTTTDRGGAFTPAILRRFDVVIWNNISGDVLTLRQRAAFKAYMERGGGFVGVHGSAGDPVYFWDWYVDTLIGARFAGHPLSPQFQTARVLIDDSAHPIAQGLPASWEANEEWYSFKASPRLSGAHIIATLDEATYKPGSFGGQQLVMGDHPIAWTRCIGPRRAGRSFYSAIGHRPERYSDETTIRMLEQAVTWAAGQDGKPCQ